MNLPPDEHPLTFEERALAAQHWEALMFTFSSTELETARLELLQAPLPVQHAVMVDINDHWLREYQPLKSENPFALAVTSDLHDNLEQEPYGTPMMDAVFTPTTSIDPDITFLEGMLPCISQWAQCVQYSLDENQASSALPN